MTPAFGTIRGQRASESVMRLLASCNSPPRHVDAERAWDYFCTHHTPFLREYLEAAP